MVIIINDKILWEKKKSRKFKKIYHQHHLVEIEIITNNKIYLATNNNKKIYHLFLVIGSKYKGLIVPKMPIMNISNNITEEYMLEVQVEVAKEPIYHKYSNNNNSKTTDHH